MSATPKAENLIGRFAVHAMSRSGEWETPQSVFDQYDREFGFTLDVCATVFNAKCASYFSPSEDGLSQDWGANVCWMNPPYGREIANWMRKAHEAAQHGATVVCLVPARTDTKWWHDYAERAAERRFLKGRLRFRLHGVPIGSKEANCPFPSAIVVFLPAPQRVEADQ
jgi:site-specific DNA-methyltransferase (adenine-specific)